MKTLSDYAKENHIHYRTAWNAYKAGKIPGAFKNDFGKVLIPSDQDKAEHVVCYARVSSSMNRKEVGMIRVVLIDKSIEIWRNGKHRFYNNINMKRYECIRKILVENNFEFYPTNFGPGIEAIKYAKS